MPSFARTPPLIAAAISPRPFYYGTTGRDIDRTPIVDTDVLDPDAGQSAPSTGRRCVRRPRRQRPRPARGYGSDRLRGCRRRRAR
jgi:hypothetical protein